MKSKVLKYFKEGLGMLRDESGTKPIRIKVAGKTTVGKSTAGPAAGLSENLAAETVAVHSHGGFAIIDNYASPSPFLDGFDPFH